MSKSLSTFLILRGILAVILGIVALAWPGATALVLVLIVGSWAVFAGLFGVFVALRSDELARSRPLFILGGLGTVAFGVSLFARPGMGAVTLALLFGMFSLTTGAGLIMQGIGLRKNRKARPSVVPHTKAA